MKILMLTGGGGHTGYTYTLAHMLHGRADLRFLIDRCRQEEMVAQINQNIIYSCPLCIKELRRKLL